MSNRDEPSYLAFARANVREALNSPWAMVRELVARIDRDSSALKAAQPRTIKTVDEVDALPVGSVVLDRDGDAWQRYRTGWTCTDRSTNTADQPSSSLAWVLAPATVLYEPGTGQ